MGTFKKEVALAAIKEHGPNKPPVKLAGEDGNAFAVIARCVRAAKSGGWSKEQIEALRADMMSGDYDHLLMVALQNFDADGEDGDEGDDGDE